MTHRRLHVGMRTVKSALAVTVALLIVEQYGATASKMIFALIGALSAMEPTFKGAVRNCLTQICGVVFGAVFGVVVGRLPIDAVWVIGLGVILIITAYNFLGLTLSPALPCIILVTVCANPDIVPAAYALGRIWDTAIGLGAGLCINMLLFPYNNSRQIRRALSGLDRELMRFLEDFFDGDEELPDTAEMRKRIAEIDRQLSLFADQRLPHRKRQERELGQLRRCDEMAKDLVAELTALSRLPYPGRLSGEIKQRLANSGAVVLDTRIPTEPNAIDVVTNYHVDRVLALRRKLRESLKSH